MRVVDRGAHRAMQNAQRSEQDRTSLHTALTRRLPRSTPLFCGSLPSLLPLSAVGLGCVDPGSAAREDPHFAAVDVGFVDAGKGEAVGPGRGVEDGIPGGAEVGDGGGGKGGSGEGSERDVEQGRGWRGWAGQGWGAVEWFLSPLNKAREGPELWKPVPNAVTDSAGPI